MSVIKQRRKIFKSFAITDHSVIAKLPMQIASKQILSAKSKEAKTRLVMLALYALEQDKILSSAHKKASIWDEITRFLKIKKDTKNMSKVIEKDIVGLDEMSATDILKSSGVEDIRILEKDGEVYSGSMDMNENRYNLFLDKNGKVYKFSIG